MVLSFIYFHVMSGPVDERLTALLALAETQRGLVTWSQLVAGITSKLLARLLAEGWLRRVRTGVYAVAGRRPSRWEDAVAVGLLAGPNSALSHGTAAAVHRFSNLIAPPVPEISVLRPRQARLRGATVHRVANLDTRDVVKRSGVSVTTPARTVVDLAARLHPELLEKIIDEGSIGRVWSPAELLACAERTAPQGRPGSRVLRDVLGPRLHEPRADSMLERRMIRVLAPYAPFETQFQLVLDGELIILDIAWPWWQVGAEVDGWSVRGRSRRKFDRDMARINLLEAHHWQVAHLTSTMDEATVLRDVGRLLPPWARASLAF